MTLDELRTPALVLDAGRVRANARRMRERVQAAGVALRLHVKTSKCLEVAALATGGPPAPLTVSTLAEAAGFAAAGYRDLTYAVTLAPSKVDAVAALERDFGARVTALADDSQLIRPIGERAAAAGVRLRMLVEVDCGDHRTGCPPDSPALLEAARAVDAHPALELAGVLTHAGHSYACDSAAAIVEVAEEERAAVVEAAVRLRTDGLPCPTVSAGSTPTAVLAGSFEGLTEIRPGVYLFFDLTQHGLGVCAVEDIALTVVATVLSACPGDGRWVVDAGALALSKDRGASRLLPDSGYGRLCDLSGRPLGSLHVVEVDQEHGFVEGAPPDGMRLTAGDRVRILPSHACLTAAAHERYRVVEDGLRVLAEWDRIRGW